MHGSAGDMCNEYHAPCHSTFLGSSVKLPCPPSKKFLFPFLGGRPNPAVGVNEPPIGYRGLPLSLRIHPCDQHIPKCHLSYPHSPAGAGSAEGAVWTRQAPLGGVVCSLPAPPPWGHACRASERERELPQLSRSCQQGASARCRLVLPPSRGPALFTSALSTGVS